MKTPRPFATSSPNGATTGPSARNWKRTLWAQRRRLPHRIGDEADGGRRGRVRSCCDHLLKHRRARRLLARRERGRIRGDHRAFRVWKDDGAANGSGLPHTVGGSPGIPARPRHGGAKLRALSTYARRGKCCFRSASAARATRVHRRAGYGLPGARRHGRVRPSLPARTFRRPAAARCHRARLPYVRACCCSTNRSPRSTHPYAARWWANSRTCIASFRPLRCCTSRTTKAKR